MRKVPESVGRLCPTARDHNGYEGGWQTSLPQCFMPFNKVCERVQLSGEGKRADIASHF